MVRIGAIFGNTYYLISVKKEDTPFLGMANLCYVKQKLVVEVYLMPDHIDIFTNLFHCKYFVKVIIL